MTLWAAFLLGMASAFALSTAIVWAIVWHEGRRKRIAAYEQFEHVDYDSHAGIQWTPEQLASIRRTKAYSPPAYGRVVK